MNQIGMTLRIASIAAIALMISACSGFKGVPGAAPIVSQNLNPTFQPQALALSISQVFSNLSGTVTNLVNDYSLQSSCVSISSCESSSETILSSCSGITGSTSILFSSPTCSALQSNSVTVVPDLQIADGSSEYNLSSDNQKDFRGVNFGGGFQVGYSLTAGSATFTEPGMRLTSSGAFDIFSRTLGPINIQANLSSMDFIAQSGSLELVDNTNQYVTTVSVNSLEFNATCLCPVSGVITGSITGSFTGTMTMTFNSCGSATINALGQSQAVSVPACQL